MKIKTLTRCLSVIACGVAMMTHAQTLPNAPTKPPAPTSYGAYNYLYQFGLTCGTGASISSLATNPTVQCGGVMVWPYMEFEAGVMGPQASQSSVTGYLTTNIWGPVLHLGDKKHGLVLATGGYAHIFGTGNGFDYGVGYALPVNESHSIRFEARDYWTFSNPSEHNVVFRVTWLVGVPD